MLAIWYSFQEHINILSFPFARDKCIAIYLITGYKLILAYSILVKWKLGKHILQWYILQDK